MVKGLNANESREGNMNIIEMLDARDRRNAEGNWIPACGGTERPFVKNGFRLLYVWQASTGDHAYLNLDTDILLSDADCDALGF
jgi:hypothetical protein